MIYGWRLAGCSPILVLCQPPQRKWITEHKLVTAIASEPRRGLESYLVIAASKVNADTQCRARAVTVILQSSCAVLHERSLARRVVLPIGSGVNHLTGYSPILVVDTLWIVHPLIPVPYCANKSVMWTFIANVPPPCGQRKAALNVHDG